MVVVHSQMKWGNKMTGNAVESSSGRYIQLWPRKGRETYATLHEIFPENVLPRGATKTRQESSSSPVQTPFDMNARKATQIMAGESRFQWWQSFGIELECEAHFAHSESIPIPIEVEPVSTRDTGEITIDQSEFRVASGDAFVARLRFFDVRPITRIEWTLNCFFGRLPNGGPLRFEIDEARLWPGTNVWD